MNVIKGNTAPKAEEKTFYEVGSGLFAISPSPFFKEEQGKYIWTLSKKEKGTWMPVAKNIKYGKKVPYTFGEKVVGIPYKIEVHQEGKNLLNQVENKFFATLIVTPRTAKEPSIGRVILLNRGKANVNKADFNESLSAQARTTNLVGREITFYLWEEGAKEEDKYKKPKKARVDKNGIAEVKFSLMEYASQPTLMDYFMAKENTTKNFFFTAVYENKKATNKGAVEASDANSNAPKKEDSDGILSKGSEVLGEGWKYVVDAVEKVLTATSIDNQQTEKDSIGGCPRCKNDITLKQIKGICVGKKDKNGKETSLIKDDTFIKSALPYLNEYRKKAGINTCITKAHFLAQISQETKFYDLQERFKYTNPERMRKLFYSYFKQFGTLEKQQIESKRLSDLSLNSANWKEVANAIYGKTHPNGNHNTDKDDGWRYSGKGYKQITWRDNYSSLQAVAKKTFGVDVTWIDNDNPYKLKNNQKDAILSGLAFWKQKNITGVATEISDSAVKIVTSLINPALAGLDERKRFFKKAVEILEVEKCKPKGKINISDENGTVVVVSGTDTKIEKDAFKPTEFSWVMYKTIVFKDMSLKTYYDLEKDNQLPSPDYTTYLSRDTHQTSTSKGKILKHSDKRFGQYNEIPPGEYFLVPGVSGQKYKIYVIDSESKSAASENGIEGPDGSRGGVALHQYSPRFSVGCFTFNSGKNTKPIQDLIDNIPDLPIGDKKPVRFIIEPRKIIESTWDDPSFGTKKWKGI